MPHADSSYLNIVNNCLSKGAQLVAVTKTQPIDRIMPLYQAGQRVFGENRVQELITKKQQMPQDCQWHLIGHLQTNKVKDVLPHVELIHSLDRLKLWEALETECQKAGVQISCLLQIKVAAEETKYGWDPEELDEVLKDKMPLRFENVKLKGIMGMTTFTDDMEIVRKELKTIANVYHHIKSNYFDGDSTFSVLSMGMSGDYQIALEEGSTMVRIGSLLFS